MKLIDLYVAEVGRRLPRQQRADIEAELRSALEDSVDDMAREQGQAPDDALAAEVLRRYGSPEKTAASYLPPRYLIGPELFTQYVKVVGVVSGAVVLALAIAFGADLGASPEARAHVGVALAQAFAGLLDAVFRGAAIVTVIFAIVQWNYRRMADEPKTWDPASLKAKPGHEPNRISPFELSVETVGALAALVIFNLYPQWVGIYVYQNGHWLEAPVLAQVFFHYLPWLNLWWSAQILLNLMILAQRRRQPITHWVWLGLGVARIAIFLAIVLGPAIIQLDAATLGSLGWGAIDAQSLSSANEGLNTLVRVGLGIVAAASAVNIARELYQQLFSGRVRLAL